MDFILVLLTVAMVIKLVHAYKLVSCQAELVEAAITYEPAFDKLRLTAFLK
jgi:hypothetical protein